VTSRRPAPTTLAFHASRIVVDVGVLIVMLAMSLPFVTTAGGNRSSMLLDALPTVLLLGPIFLITLIPDHTRPIPRVLGWASLVLGLAAFPYAVVKYLDSSVLARTLGGGVGMGARLLVLGSFVTLVGIVIGLARSFLGLEAGGTPGRTKAVRTRPGPAGDADEEIEDDQPSDDVALVATAPMPTAPPPTGRPAPQPKPAADAPKPRPQPSPTAIGPAAKAAPATPPAAASVDHPQPRPRPSRPGPEENPFGSPLFDSIEMPELPESDRQPSLSFEAEDATERVVDDET
jgi:hypothetical protein